MRQTVMKSDCVMSKADASQRGHTCWIDSAIVSISNSITARKMNNKRGSFPTLQRQSTTQRISSEIMEHGGQEKYEEKIHLSLTQLLGKDVCPMKPKDGHNVLSFMKNLMMMMEIENVFMSRVIATSNSPIPVQDLPEIKFLTFDMSTFLNNKGSQHLHVFNLTSGIFVVQVLSPQSMAAKITGLQEEVVIGDYNLKLRNMLVSTKGHVMTYGTCDKPHEWYVYDNEFSGKGSPPRKFETVSFQATMDLIFNYPHTYFSPKMGTVPMNPLFLQGPQSATTFMFDFEKNI